MTYDFRFASAKKPLYGHTSPQTAYLIDDYPHGFRDRCKKRVWLEFKAKQGFRLVEQTSQSWYPGSGETAPPDALLRWAKPKASTYVGVAACMYLDAQDHVQWEALHHNATAAQCSSFMKDFPQADFTGIKAQAIYNIKYTHGRLRGAIVMTMNGKPLPESETALEDARVHLGVWLGVAEDVKLQLNPAFLQECKDLVDGKTPPTMIDPVAWKAERQREDDAAAAAKKEKAESTKGALTAAEFVELLEKKIDPKDRILKIEGDERGSMRSGQVFVHLYNVPKSENKGTNASNNRWVWVIEGFDRKDPNIKAVKVKLEQGASEGAPFEDRAKWKLRGKSGTPQQVAEYLAKFVHKVVSEVEPRLQKYASYDRSPSL